MGKKLLRNKTYTSEEVYEIVSNKWNVDHPDGSTNMFEFWAKATAMDFKEISEDVWIKTNGVK